MPSPSRIALALTTLLVACGTPQEQCIARNTRDLRTVENLISEAEGNLARGFAYRTETEFYTDYVPCPAPREPEPGEPPLPPQPVLCPEIEERETRVPVSIDLDAEARKLVQLRERRQNLQRQAESVITQCRAAYPE